MDDMTPKEDLLDCEINDGVACLTFNRPNARNALSLAMIAALHGEVNRLGADKAVKVIVLAGKGLLFVLGMI